MKEIEIFKEPVELYKILKFEGIVSSGGEAKAVINDGQVLVNGEIETRKRKKIVAGDIIEFMNEQFKIILKQNTKILDSTNVVEPT
jgi:ribosome-associated protein